MTAEREFAFLLCCELGIADPDKLMAAMPATLFNEWRQFHARYPFGPQWEWFRNSQILSMIANLFRGKETPAARPQDFMPQEKKKREPVLTPTQQIVSFGEIAGATVIDLRGDTKHV